MKLIVLNITPNDSIKVTNYLRKTPVYFIKIASIGGVISNGSYTYLIKVSDELLDEVIKNTTSICKTRKVKINSINNVEMGMFHNISTTQKEGGASIFVVDLEQFIKV
ncbi:MAG: hypothetical protein E7183_06010 [Erysipelotrichaceae bacterium]|nr:hypothetical protein [Erysipelotrichaceae bacterium]